MLFFADVVGYCSLIMIRNRKDAECQVWFMKKGIYDFTIGLLREPLDGALESLLPDERCRPLCKRRGPPLSFDSMNTVSPLMVIFPVSSPFFTCSISLNSM